MHHTLYPYIRKWNNKMIRKLEFSHNRNHYLRILALSFLVPLPEDNIPALPGEVITEQQHRGGGRPKKRKEAPTNDVASICEQRRGHRSNKSLPSRSKSGQSCIGKRWVWTAATYSNEIPYYTIAYIREVWGGGLKDIYSGFRSNWGSEPQAVIGSHRLSKAGKWGEWR